MWVDPKREPEPQSLTLAFRSQITAWFSSWNRIYLENITNIWTGSWIRSRTANTRTPLRLTFRWWSVVPTSCTNYWTAASSARTTRSCRHFYHLNTSTSCTCNCRRSKCNYTRFVRVRSEQMRPTKMRFSPQFYMQNRPDRSEEGKTRSSILFQDFQNLQRIWTHPRVLRYNSDRYEIAARKRKEAQSDDEEGSLKDFIDDEDDDEEVVSLPSTSSNSSSDSEHSAQSIDSDKPKVSKKSSTQLSRRTRANTKILEPEVIEPVKEENPTEWWMSLCGDDDLNNVEHSGKLMLLFSLLAECEAIGDKVLVFSQSLFSLDVIEHFLSMIDENTQNPNPELKLSGFSGSWSPGLDYFRLDGSTPIEMRNAACNEFNREENTRARLFLISTRAGGLGINLVAANRVVIFDASWNPSHDVSHHYQCNSFVPSLIYTFRCRFKVSSACTVSARRNPATFTVLSLWEQWNRRSTSAK